MCDNNTATNRVSKGDFPLLLTETYVPPGSYGSSKCVGQLISGACAPIGKQAGLHFVQSIRSFPSLAQAQALVPFFDAVGIEATALHLARQQPKHERTGFLQSPPDLVADRQ